MASMPVDSPGETPDGSTADEGLAGSTDSSGPHPVLRPVRFVIEAASAGERLDRFLTARFPEQSRSALARAIDRGAARVDGVVARASVRLREGSCVVFEPPPAPREGPAPEAIPLDFLHVDEAIAVVDKPAGMVVHPAKGNWKGTLAGALLWHLEAESAEGDPPEASGLSRAGGLGLSRAGGPTRPGIVHRLDRDTSGVIIVARTEAAHHHLARQFERRSVEKEYLAITQGVPQFDSDEIDLPIGVHPYQREKMAIRRDHPTARDAVTRYEVLERFRAAALVRVRPRTGRTHQIRVHLAAIGCPVLCDLLYSGRGTIPAGFFAGPSRGSDRSRGEEGEAILRRQALHAASLAVDHPLTGERSRFAAALPDDLLRVLETLRLAG
jgi:23S rRNA pseudouridine1911/1915/1917 synthase